MRRSFKDELLIMLLSVVTVQGINMFGDYKKIKESLLKGGLVIAPRRYGKTLALIEILHEDKDSCVVCMDEENRQYLISAYVERNEETSIENRIFTPSKLKGRKLLNKKIFVDEYFYNDYRDEFFAAVSSTSFRVDLIKPTFDEALEISKTLDGREHLTKYEFCLYD